MFSVSKFRSLFLTTLCLTLGAAVLGCGKGDTAGTGTLRFSHFWAEPAQREVMESLMADFRKEYPNIPLEVTELSWSDGKTKLMVGFNSKTAPDVMELGSDWVPQFSSSGELMELGASQDIMQHVTGAPDYSREPGMWSGKYYAVPWLLDTRVMFVNDDLVAAAKQTSPVLKDWASMLTTAKAIEASGKGRGMGINGADAHRLYKKFLPYVWSNGGRLFDDNLKPTLADPKNVEALQFYIDQQSAGLVETQKNLDDAFKRGTLGMWFSGSWMLTPLEKATFKWHTEPFPGNAGNAGVSFAGGEYLAINNSSTMKKEAEQLVSFILRPENQLRFAKAVNMYPADMQMQKDSFYVQRREGPIFTEQLQHARMTPVLPQWLDIEAIIEDAVSRALYKKATPAEALAAAQQSVQSLLAKP